MSIPTNSEILAMLSAKLAHAVQECTICWPTRVTAGIGEF